jgi:hypothetical protein
MSNSKYQYVDGFHAPKGLPAEIAAEELESIRVSTGQLIPENIVSAASSKENPLHVAFEWDDSVAGHKFRLHQASQLTRSITIIREEHPQPFRFFTLVRDDNQPRASYLPTETVVKRPDLYEDGLARLKRELEGAQKSVKELIMIGHRSGRNGKYLAKASVLLEKATELVK